MSRNTQQEGLTMNMEQFNPTAEEFATVMQQMYPDQSARVISDLRAAKMSQFLEEQEKEQAKSKTAVKKTAAKRATSKTATTGKAK